MSEQPVFECEPWTVTERTLSLDLIAQSESVFALSNGHIGLRGNLDEGEPHGLPGTYLGGVYELRPLPAAERAYGQPEASQTVANVTNGKVIRLLVDDEPFDVRYGHLDHHVRTLDLQEGTLRREVEWTSPGHRRVAVRSTRLVSLSQRAVAAICYEVATRDDEIQVAVQSELVANEVLPDGLARSRATGDLPDPRASGALERPLVAEHLDVTDLRIVLSHRTRESGLALAALMDHEVLDAPDDTDVVAEASPDLGRVTVLARLGPGQRLRFVKYLAYGWSAERSRPALEDQVVGAAHTARQSGFDGLVDAQRAYLERFWSQADVCVDGDAEVQQAVRFALFHVLQSSARAEGRAIPAKGLTGSGYDGHAFWDTETFVLPVLTATAPSAAADALRWRHATLPMAIQRAAQLGLAGAAFPWRTIHGEESSGYWPASTAAFHVNADVADAAARYVESTGDESLAGEVAVDLLVETARLWASLGHYDDGRGFRIDGVTGPDEYSAVADNNVYTNLMAQRNLRAAAAIVAHHPERAAEIGVDDAEVRAWVAAADAVVIPYDDDAGVHPQADGFTRHQTWDFEATGEDHYPLMLHFPYFDLYRKQVVKQADLVLAMYLCGDSFTAEEKARDFAYYEGVTVRDSSLSAAVQAIVAAEVGHTDLAYDYLAEAALMDLDDLEHNTRDGLHMAALAGSWLALVAGLGGLRVGPRRVAFSPRLPGGLRRLRFRLRHRGATLEVDVAGDEAAYRVVDGGGPVTVLHHGEEVTLAPGRAERRRIPPARPGPRPTQPAGREPERRLLPRADPAGWSPGDLSTSSGRRGSA
jgi:alpha,alpha-trehalose phosphorylase